MKHKISINDDVTTFTFYSDYFNKSILKDFKIVLNFLNIENKRSFKPKVNPTRKPCYIFYKYSIVVETKNEEVLKDLFMYYPKIRYATSQRKGRNAQS